ncbi:MAG: S8 family serine peptidase [Candidatus Dojkabacteria bacterium]
MQITKSTIITNVIRKASIVALSSLLTVSFISPKLILAEDLPSSFPVSFPTEESITGDEQNALDNVKDKFSEYSEEELNDATAKVREALIVPAEDNFFVVKFKDEESADRVSQEVAPEDVIPNRYTALLGEDVRLIKIDNQEEKIDQMTLFNLNDSVEYVETNQIVKKEAWTTTGTTAKPNDFNNTNHWYHLKTKLSETYKDEGCPSANACGGSSSLIVAVLDTGMAFETNTGATYREYLGGSSFIDRTPLNFTPAPELTGISLWTNPSENYTGNDEDGNFICDDLHGADMIAVVDNLSLLSSGQWASNCASGTSWVVKEGHPNDDDGHGSYVANMIASLSDNSASSFGGAFKTQIMPIKVLDYTGTGTTFTIAQGIRYAVNKGAKILNISIAGLTSPSATLEDAISYANSNGVLLIISSGNQALSSLEYPSAYSNSYNNVISVGASNTSDTRASYSSYGTGLDLVAPVGTGASAGNAAFAQTFNDADSWAVTPVASRNFTTYTNKYWIGTSFAAPQVTSAAALLWAEYSNLSPALIKSYLRSSATDVSTAGYDTQTGYGIVNIKVARDQVSLGVGFPWIPFGNTNKDLVMIDINGTLFQTIINSGNYVLTRSTTGATDSSNNPVWGGWILSGGGNPGVNKVFMAVSNNKLYQSIADGGIVYTRFHTSGNVDGGGPIWSSWIASGGTAGDVYMVDLNNKLFQTVADGVGNVWSRTTTGSTDGGGNLVWTDWKFTSGAAPNKKLYIYSSNNKIYQALVAGGYVYTRYHTGSNVDGSGDPIWGNWILSGGTSADIFFGSLGTRLFQSVVAGGFVYTRSTTGALDGSNNPIWTTWVFNGGTPSGVTMTTSNSKLYQEVVAGGYSWTRFTDGALDGSNVPIWSAWIAGKTANYGVFSVNFNNRLFESVLATGYVWTRSTDGTLDGSSNPIWTNWVLSGGSEYQKVYMTTSGTKMFQAVLSGGLLWTRYFVAL